MSFQHVLTRHFGTPTGSNGFDFFFQGDEFRNFIERLEANDLIGASEIGAQALKVVGEIW